MSSESSSEWPICNQFRKNVAFALDNRVFFWYNINTYKADLARSWREDLTREKGGKESKAYGESQKVDRLFVSAGVKASALFCQMGFDKFPEPCYNPI
jgi:hypothetical protein